MDKFISKNENNLKEKKYLDQSIKERNKVIEDFMNDMDKKIEKENYEEEEEDDFDKIENEYMRKKNEESKRKNKEKIKLIKEQNDNYEKYIKDKINEEREKIYDSNMIKKTDYENNNKTIYQKHFFPKLYQNPENIYLIENLKKREKQKMKKFYDKKNKNEERINHFNRNLSKEKLIENLKNQNIKLFKLERKNIKESHSTIKTKFKRKKNKKEEKEDKKNEEEENNSFEEFEKVFSTYRNNKLGYKSGKTRRKSQKEKNIFNKCHNNNLNNQLNEIQNYKNNRLKSDCLLPSIYKYINQNHFNGNKTFTNFSNNNYEKKSFSGNLNLNKFNNNKIQFDIILNHFE
jgi:hypothetical protein